MQKKTKLQKLTETMVGQIEVFIAMCKFAKVNGAMGGKGITKQDLLKKGLTEETFQWLKSHHYCNEQKKGQPLWVAINGNKLYPDRTVAALEDIVNDFKAEKAKEEKELLEQIRKEAYAE